MPAKVAAAQVGEGKGHRQKTPNDRPYDPIPYGHCALARAHNRPQAARNGALVAGHHIGLIRKSISFLLGFDDDTYNRVKQSTKRAIVSALLLLRSQVAGRLSKPEMLQVAFRLPRDTPGLFVKALKCWEARSLSEVSDIHGLEGVEQTLLSIHASSMQQDFRREALFDWIERHLPPAGKCLDVGCGTGFMVEKLWFSGLEVIGIEKCEPLLAFAKDQLGRKGVRADLVLGDSNEAPRYGPFDVIVCLDVIEHVQDHRAALLALYNACTPDARLVLSVPAISQLYGKRDRSLGHFRRYDKATLLERLDEAGFRVELCQFWNLAGVVPYWFNERVLSRPANDSLRVGKDSSTKRLIRNVFQKWLSLEGKCMFLPFGLSLVCVSRAGRGFASQ